MSAASAKSSNEIAVTGVPDLLCATLQRLGSQSAACKLWSVILSSVVLVMAAGRTGAEVLVWAAAPAVLLALADAAYTSQGQRIAALIERETVCPSEIVRTQISGSGFAGAFQSLAGLGSFSVWPFYVGLAGLVITLGHTVLVPQNNRQQAPPMGLPGAINTPYASNVPRPAYSIQQGPGSIPAGAVIRGGSPTVSATAPPAAPSLQFQPPPTADQLTVTRPNIPPMGQPKKKAGQPSVITKSPTTPIGTAPPNRSSTSPIIPPPPPPGDTTTPKPPVQPANK